MKKNLLLLLLFVLFTTCESKTKIISLSNYCIYDHSETESIYVKDINRVFEPYIGTWIWQNNKNKLILIINKVEKVKSKYLKKQIFKDELHGRIKFIKNNRQEASTLNDSVPTLRSIIKYKIIHADKLPVIEQKCSLYSQDSIRVSYNDPLIKSYFKGYGNIKLINKNKISLVIQNRGGFSSQPDHKPIDILNSLIEGRDSEYSLLPINQTFTLIKK